MSTRRDDTGGSTLLRRAAGLDTLSRDQTWFARSDPAPERARHRKTVKSPPGQSAHEQNGPYPRIEGRPSLAASLFLRLGWEPGRAGRLSEQHSLAGSSHARPSSSWLHKNARAFAFSFDRFCHNEGGTRASKTQPPVKTSALPEAIWFRSEPFRGPKKQF